MVWLAAWKAGWKRIPFRKYALLGDDIVIADKAVAESYKELVKAMGLSISETQSLVSDNGSLEFAKQFWVDGKNLSPVSAKALLSATTFVGLVQFAEKSNLNQRK